jgi:hypothetical protein
MLARHRSPLLLTLAAAGALSAAPAAHAADPTTIDVKVSSHYAYSGSSIKVSVRANVAGKVRIGQERTFKFNSTSAGCGLPDLSLQSINSNRAFEYKTGFDYTTPGTWQSVTVPSTALSFIGGDLVIVPGSPCQHPATQFNQLAAQVFPNAPSWDGAGEARTALSRLF